MRVGVRVFLSVLAACLNACKCHGPAHMEKYFNNYSYSICRPNVFISQQKEYLNIEAGQKRQSETKEARTEMREREAE